MNKKLLFVTKGGEECDEGFSYALELAKTLSAGISILMVYGKRVRDTYADVMAAVAFAEAGELETVREVMQKQEEEIETVESKKIAELSEKCKKATVDFSCQIGMGEPISAINETLKNRPNIDMILLSPSIAANKKLLNIKKLFKSITKPIVTITKTVKAEA